MVHRGGDEKAQQTAKWAVAIFQHTTARPEKVEMAPGKTTNYSAPHLHTHAFWINLARDQDGKFRAVEPGFMYHAQRFGAAVAGAEMAYELKRLGYDVQQDKSTQTHAPMIAGYTDEYLKAESPRSQQIKKKTAEIGYWGRRAEEIVAHQYRNEKLGKPAEEIKEDHLKITAQYGNQQERIIAERDEGRLYPSPNRTWDAATALTHAKESLSIRTDVFTERDLLTKALHIGQGYVRLPELRNELKRRSQSNRDFEEGISKEFIQARHAMESNEPGMRWTTQGAKDKEHQVIQLTLTGQNTVEPILRTETTSEGIQQRFAHLNKGKGITGEQAQAVLEIVISPDKVYGLQGVAGGGKTSSVLAPVRELAEEAGFEVIGLAPTGKARQELEKAGIRHTMTLQKYLKVTEGYLEKKGINPEKPRYFIVDEQSMVSSQQDLEFLRSVVRSKRPRDRVLEAGDLRQHESVEAGRIFEEQMQAGMRFISVNTILRQQTEDYRRVVEYFQVEKPHLALMKLEEMGWITVTPQVAERQKALAQRYASDPENHIAATPFNQTRQELNEAIREALQGAGKLTSDVIRNATIYVQRQDLTSADLKLAMNYQRGNVLVFHQNVTVEDAIGRSHRIERGQYGEVVNRSSDPKRQWLEIALYGENKTVRYDPMELHKVAVYEKHKRHFAIGEKIVFKNPYRGLENGSRLTIMQAETNGNILAKDERSNRTLAFNVKDNPHLEYGYTYTSQAIQGGTTKTVLWDLPTAEKGASAAFTNALGYVSSSRGTHEVHLYTDDLQRAMTLLSNHKVKAIALNDEEIFEYKLKTQQSPEPTLTSPPLTSDPRAAAVRI